MHFTRASEQAARYWAACIQKIYAFIVSHVVPSIAAAVQATIAQRDEFRVDLICYFDVCEEVDILCGPHNVVRGKSQTANQRIACANSIQ